MMYDPKDDVIAILAKWAGIDFDKRTVIALGCQDILDGNPNSDFARNARYLAAGLEHDRQNSTKIRKNRTWPWPWTARTLTSMSQKLIDLIEKQYEVSYIGYYDIPGRDGVYVFYQPNPKVELGHSNYLGVILDYRASLLTYGDTRSPEVWLCDAKTIVEAKYPAIRFEDGYILCSRGRHDYVEYNDGFLDGGLDYTRCNPSRPPTGYIQIVGDKEKYVDNG